MAAVHIAILFLIAFIAECIDIILGMGFGTIMTPLLIGLGYNPLVVLPIVLLLQAIAGMSAGVSHHMHENIDFFHKEKLKITSVFVLVGSVGAVGGAFVATHINLVYLEIIIGAFVILAGIALFFSRFIHKTKKVSYKRLCSFCVVAAFAKTMTGVYGPIVTPGQILSGIDEKEAVATTSMAEGITSLVGFLAFAYFVAVDWSLFLPLLIAILIAVPLSTYVVKIAPKHYLRRGVGTLVMTLGIILLVKIWLGYI
jgi:uncharacterized membrane protein YfcA